MKNILNKIAFAALTLLCVSCQKEYNAAPPTTEITPSTLRGKVGEAIAFKISGECDFVTFWSGESGHKYANRNKINAVINSASLNFSSAAAYGNSAQERALSIFISEDFKAQYNVEGVTGPDVTWVDVTPANTPIVQPDMNTYIVADPVDLSQYAGKSFYVALKYTQQALSGTRRQVKVRDFEVSADTDEGKFLIADINTGLFKSVKVSGTATGWIIGSDTKGKLFDCRGTADGEQDEYWYISKELILDRVNSDAGASIKTMTDYIQDYSYTFASPGTYRVTFELVNARYGKKSTTIREFDIVVEDYVPTPVVDITPSKLELNAGETVDFDFEGDCAIIDFWSGTKGHEYRYRDRTNIAMTDASFVFESAAYYGDATERAFSVLISEDFNGTYTKAALQAATWSDVTPDNVPNKQATPPIDNYILSQGGLMSYNGKKFYVGLRYKQSGLVTKRTVTLKDFMITGTDGTEDYPIVPNFEGGNFKQIVASDPVSASNGWVVATTAPKLKARPVGATKAVEEYWMVSKQLDMNTVAPDSGVAIINDVLSKGKYSYKFTDAGTYTVTFVLTNKSDFGSVNSVNKEFTVKVN